MNTNIETKISYNRPGSPSLKTTIPQGIVHFLSLESGKSIIWEMEIREGKRIAIITKSSEEE